MSELPDPMTPSDCDCRGLGFMPLDVMRLRDSDLALLSTGDEFKGALLLWCASWHQLPAGSLPNDDRVLGRLSGLDRAWRRARDMALRGWVECSDGRLYHPVVAEKALEAWGQRVRYRQKRETDRARLRDWRDRKQADPFDGNAPETPDETRFETPKTGRGRGTGTNTPPERTPSVAPEPGKEAWQRAVQLLTSAGRMTEAKARTFIGGLLRDHRLEASDLLPSIVKAETSGTADPAAYLVKAAQGIAARRGTAPAGIDVTAWTDEHWEIAMGNWRSERAWSSEMGPQPGQPGCLVPPSLLVEAVA